MEVALKMALRATGKRYGWRGVDGHEVGVIGLKGGYHGDTVGGEGEVRHNQAHMILCSDRLYGCFRSKHFQYRR